MNQLKKIQCSSSNNLSKKTFLAMLREPTKSFFENIDENKWFITSFNPRDREVCVVVLDKTVKNLSVTLPYLSASKI